MKWEKVRLGELYSVHNGLSKGRKFFGTGFPFLSFSTVFNNFFIPDELYDLVESNENEQISYSIKKGDVFITRTSETSDELGMSCVALKDYPFATYNGFTKRLRPFDVDRVNHKYIGYYMRTPNFRGNFQAFSTMTTRASLKNENLLSLEIILPPIETQRRIADILSAYDDLIENNQKQIKLLEEAAQRLYKEWFVDLRFPGYEQTKIIDGVPEGWKVGTIFDVCLKINAGGTPNRKNPVYWQDKSVKWYKTGELQDGWLIDSEEYISKQGLEFSAAKLFPKNTILMAIYASPTLGRLGILSDESACNQAALCLVADENKVSWQWLYYKLFELRDNFNAIAKGAGQQNISAETVKKTSITYPSKSIMDMFTKVSGELLVNMYILQKQNAVLKEARDRLLPKLMSGEIEV